MYTKLLTLTLIPEQGYVIENRRGALDFLLSLDAKGWLNRAEFNRGRNFFLKGIERLEAFRKYCGGNNVDVMVRGATSYTTYTYDDHNEHVYAFNRAPLNLKKDWTRIQIAKQEKELTNTCYASADGYYAAKDNLRRLCAGLEGKTENEYDPMGVWFGRQSN